MFVGSTDGKGFSVHVKTVTKRDLGRVILIKYSYQEYRFQIPPTYHSNTRRTSVVTQLLTAFAEKPNLAQLIIMFFTLLASQGFIAVTTKPYYDALYNCI